MQKLTFLVAAAVLAAGLQTTSAQNAAPGDKLLASAQHKATVDGDLKGAIEDYKKIVGAAGSNRALAATALLRMAECYQKLGDAEAQKIYDRLVRDYADQKDAAATARTRLGAVVVTRNAGIVTRQVWTRSSETNLSRVSDDGRSIAVTDWDTGDLAVHDLATGQDRHVTHKGTWADSPEYALFPAISHNGKQVAYAWVDQNMRGELRISAMSGDNVKPRTLFSSPDVQYVDPGDWTPDDKWLAVHVVRRDRTAQLALVSVADGALRVLKSIGWGGGRPLVSPDGKYLAYDLPATEEADQSDIHIMAVDASREAVVVAHPSNDRLLGWSPDGAYLLFKSDRGGSMGVWSLPVADGRSHGEPTLIKADLNPAPIGITRSGAFYYVVNAFKGDVYVASIDFDSGTVLSPPTRIAQHYVGGNTTPEWSPDGKSLAYLSHRELPTTFNPVVVIHSLETGSVQELKPDLRVFTRPFWSPDGRFLVGTGGDKKARQGIFQVDAQTGKATPLVIVEPGQEGGRAIGGGVRTMGWSRDGKALLLGRADPKSNQERIVARDLQSGNEREFGRDEPPGPNVAPMLLSLSPDGTLRAVARADQSAKSTSLQVVDVRRGTTRELLRVADPEGIRRFLQWTPDGRFVVFVKTFGANTDRKELWRVPAEGGAARKIDLNGVVGDFVRFHPDGRRVAFTAGERAASEVWVMENFLPTANAKKP